MPTILNVVTKSKTETFESSVKMIFSAMRLKQIEDPTFDPTTINSTNLLSLLNVSNNNYQSVNVELKNSEYYITVIGKEKWEGLKAYGTNVNLIVELNETSTWVNMYGGTGSDWFNNMATESDGYIAVGEGDSTDGDLTGLNKGDYDAYIVKYDSNGNLLWNKNYGGSDYETYINVATVGNESVAVGCSNSTDGDLTGLSKGEDDAIVVKYDVNGNVVWKKNFGGSSYETFKDIATVSDGYIIVGESDSTDGDLSGLNKGYIDAIVVKYDVNGNVVWKKNFGGTGWETFNGIVSSMDGYVVVGHSSSTDGDLSGLNKGYIDAIVVKYDFNGNVVWKKNFGGLQYDTYTSLVLLTDGYITSGSSMSTDGDLTNLSKGGGDAIVVKYDFNGNAVWKKNYGGSEFDTFTASTIIADNIILVGEGHSSDGDLLGLNKGSADGIFVKYDSSGNVLSKQNYGDSRFDSLSSVETSGGFIVMTGGFYSATDDTGYGGVIMKVEQ